MARLEADKRDAEELCRRTIETLALAVEAKTGPNPGHLSRVAAYCVAIGRAMRMDEDILEGLRIAALLSAMAAGYLDAVPAAMLAFSFCGAVISILIAARAGRLRTLDLVIPRRSDITHARKVARSFLDQFA